MVRFELMDKFGYYVTESSEHNAEYHPYFIKSRYPELIGQFNIPLDEYPRRCEEQINNWNTMKHDLVGNTQITHTRSKEYGSRIIEAIETNVPFKFAGNVLNTGGLIHNLPEKACVEVPCVADRSGIMPCYVGEIPEQLAGLNRTNISSQLMTIEAAISGKKSTFIKRHYLIHTQALNYRLMTSSNYAMNSLKHMVRCFRILQNRINMPHQPTYRNKPATT